MKNYVKPSMVGKSGNGVIPVLAGLAFAMGSAMGKAIAVGAVGAAAGFGAKVATKMMGGDDDRRFFIDNSSMKVLKSAEGI